MSGAGSLDVVIVSYRCEGLLRDCLTSLSRHPASIPMRVRVVDNASGDGTAEMVAREFPEIDLSVNQENAGFSAANNGAIVAGTAPWVLALNPDTRVTAGALDYLLRAIDARPEIGVCGPRLELEDGSLDHAARRSFPTPLSALGHFSGLGRRRGARGRLAAYRAPEVTRGRVDAVNGACMLIRRSALEQVGLFDEGFWMYMEDLDLCYRLRLAGWLCWYEPAARVIHEKAGSSGPIRGPRLNYAFHYGMYRFYRKHYARDRFALTNVAVYLGIAAKLTLSLVRGAIRAAASRLRPGGMTRAPDG